MLHNRGKEMKKLLIQSYHKLPSTELQHVTVLKKRFLRRTLWQRMCYLTIFALVFLFHAQAVEIDTARGVIDAPDNPKKVVSLDIGTIDTLNALGVAVSGIPDNLYIKELQIKNAEVVGSLFEPNLEKLYALEPDWILVATLSAGKLDAVKSIAPSADISLQNVKPYSETIARMYELAKVFHKKSQAKVWEEKLNTLRDNIKANMPKDNNALIVLTTGNKIAVFDRDSRFGWLDKTLGFNVINPQFPRTEKSFPEHGTPISFEYIKEANPDWLLIIDRASAMNMNHVETAKSLLDNDLVNSTTASKKNQIIYLHPADMYVTVGGVQSIYRVLKQIDDRLSR